MNRWIKPLVAGGFAALALTSLAGIALAYGGGDDEPGDPGTEKPAPGMAMCAPGVTDCTDVVVPDDQEDVRDPADGAAGSACLVGATECADNPGSDDGRRMADPSRAPIDAVEVVVRESDPPQYAVMITSGLPNGCTSFAGISTQRDGDVIVITVANEVRDGGGTLACSMMYGQVEHTVELGSDFEPGQAYRLVINDHKETFVA